MARKKIAPRLVKSKSASRPRNSRDDDREKVRKQEREGYDRAGYELQERDGRQLRQAEHDERRPQSSEVNY